MLGIKDIKLKSEKLKKREKYIKYMKLSLLASSLFLISIYSVLSLIYADRKFTIALDNDFSKKTGMIIYEDSVEKKPKLVLEVDDIGRMDNISMDWLPQNINNQGDGNHSGENYIAYTFYVENMGTSEIDYWYRIPIDNVVKNVDEAIRFMVYRNDEKTIYAKASSNGAAEKGTEIFLSADTVVSKERVGLKPGEFDKFTIVVWLEGDDPECVDSIIGGELKMHMEFNEEFKEEEKLI